MPALPWTSSGAVEPDREYLVLASELPLRRYQATLTFARLVLQVRRQLARAPGLVGYSLLARPLARRGRTHTPASIGKPPTYEGSSNLSGFLCLVA